MPNVHRFIIIALLCGSGMPARTARGDWTTIYGSAREEALPERQVSDLLAAVALRQEPATGPVAVYGQGYTGPLAIYAALLDPQVTEIVLADCSTSHEDPQTPEFLGVLRIGDLPHNLALAYLRTITFVGTMPPAYNWTRELYEKFGAGDRVRVIDRMADGRPR